MYPKQEAALYIFLSINILTWNQVNTSTYEDHKAIFDNVFNSSIYDTRVRPVDNQSETVNVFTTFQLVSLLEIDDVGQRFVCNGFLPLYWFDMKLRWDPADYGNLDLVRPEVKDIWKPRLVLLNTLDGRDIFEDDHSPMTVHSNGLVFWAPGGLFPTSCALDMTNYPFDEQTCHVKMMGMGYKLTEVNYVPSYGPVGEAFFIPNGEWDLKSSNITEEKIAVDENAFLSSIKISFTLKRRPTFLLLNIVLPVVFLSFLNILVFLIPVDSGEKISYGVTLLLAVSVFLSIVSSMLPRSSQIVPSLTIYLACLLILSVLTVVDSVIIVFLHNLDANETANINASENFTHACDKLRQRSTTVTSIPRLASVAAMLTAKSKHPNLDTNMERPKSSRSFSDSESLPPYEEEELGGRIKRQRDRRTSTWDDDKGREPRKNRYRAICRHIDSMSFVVFFFMWLGLTLGFLISMSSS